MWSPILRQRIGDHITPGRRIFFFLTVISLLLEHVERRLAGADLPDAAGVKKLAKVVVRRGTRKSKRLLYVASRGFSIGAKQGADSLVHATDRASERRRFCLSPKL